MNRNRSNARSILKQLPTKRVVVIVVLLFGYAIAQPMLNERLGWRLPSARSLTEPAAESGGRTHRRSGTSEESIGSQQAHETRQKGDQRTDTRETSVEGRDEIEVPASSVPSQDSAGLKYGLLRDLGREEYLSPGGLKYTRGSAEGHRLKHIERHLQDQPERPGSHGVFYGDMPQVIRWLDATFSRAKAAGRGTSTRHEDQRTVYEASFEMPVGFVGGQSGKRKGNPEVRQIRMVVEGNRVITAFPF